MNTKTTTRKEKAEKIHQQDIKFCGDNLFLVNSQSNLFTIYSVNTETRTCNCPDYIRRQLPCKHVFACELWLKQNNIFNRVKSVIQNCPTWYAGQTRSVYSNSNIRISVEHSQGLLYYTGRKGTKCLWRIVAGNLNFSNLWSFTLRESEYNHTKNLV